MSTAPGHFTYVVLSHRDPEQVERLAGAIHALSPSADLIVSHDTAGSPAPVLVDDRDRVVERSDGAAWGRFALVDAVLDVFRSLPSTTEWAVVISGQDYPIVALEAWEDELRASGADALFFPLPLSDRVRFGRSRNGFGHNLARYHQRHFHFTGNRAPAIVRKLRWRVQRAATHVQPILSYWVLPDGSRTLGIRRFGTPFDGRFLCYKGTQWMAVSRRAVERVLAVDSEGTLRRYYERTLIPDESYIHTIVGNDPELVVLGRSVSEASFVDHQPNPAVVTPDDLERCLELAEKSQAAFVRKVDTSHPEVPDALDRRLGIERERQ
jgi:hypothetical protein